MRQIPEHLARKSLEALVIADDALRELADECDGAGVMVRVGISADRTRLARLIDRARARLDQDSDDLGDL